MRRVWAAAVAVVLAGCGLFEPITVQETCASLCDCAYFPTPEAECNQQCVSQLSGISQDCMECLASLTCEELPRIERECRNECVLFHLEENP